MLTLEGYLLSKNNQKKHHSKDDLFECKSLNYLWEKYIDTYGEPSHEQVKEALHMYDIYVKEYPELNNLIDYLADTAKRYINGDEDNYVFINSRSPDRHVLKERHHLITLRFDANNYWQTIIWEHYQVVGFVWWYIHHGWTLDFDGKYKSKYDLINWSKSADNFGKINKDTIDAIVYQSNKFLRSM